MSDVLPTDPVTLRAWFNRDNHDWLENNSEPVHSPEQVDYPDWMRLQNGELDRLYGKESEPKSERNWPGIEVPRYFTKAGEDPFDTVEWESTDIEILDDKGGVKFRAENVEFPKHFTLRARQIVADKYLKAARNPDGQLSFRALVKRVVGKIVEWGEQGQYYASPADAGAHYDELCYMLLHQMMAFNSPVWFNLGVPGIAQQASACFIIPVEDTMESIGSWYHTEMMIFKRGSGSGANVGRLRSSREKLSLGGRASGPISFMKGADVQAGIIKSGGVTRRAAKLVTMPIDHPDILTQHDGTGGFIRCKADEEKRAWALIDAGYSGEFNAPGGAYEGVYFQNTNHSVRISDEFMRQLEHRGKWWTSYRVTGEPCEEFEAVDLWREIAEATWVCGDPGVQYHDLINRMNPCPNSFTIRATNPCQPADAPVLTPDGIRRFRDIGVGSVIWSGQRWTRVVRKIATGIKPVLRYNTTTGFFLGTAEHQVLQDGVRVEAQAAQAIDLAVGPQAQPGAFDRQAVVDGWMLGDGTVHRATGTILLELGEKDGAFHAELGDYVIAQAETIQRYGWKVRSTVTEEELPRTWDRRVPERYLTAAPDQVRSFLRGIYAANGSVCGDRVTLKSTSLQLVRDLQLMLSSLGIASYYTTNKPKTVQFRNGEYTCRESYDLNISRHRDRFAELIGFIHPDKAARLALIVGKNERKWQKNSYEVTSVEALGEMEVFDITVDAEEHTYWTGGQLVSNCGEYGFRDDTSCNLASLNLLRFWADGVFRIEDYLRAIFYTALAMEMLVGGADYPNESISFWSRVYRTLGLGFCNLGALLMQLGLPYDSEEGRRMAAMLTSVLTSQAYCTSALVSMHCGGPYADYQRNAKHQVRVLNTHRDSHLSYSRDEVIQGNPLLAALYAKGRARWSDAVQFCEQHGVRNSQVSLMAPTGTIAFMMDADTTGLEPDVALVKYKKLVGGGYLKMVNQSVEPALQNLGYSSAEVREILDYVDQHGTVEGSSLQSQHLAVFDCAFPAPGKNRSIPWMGHLKMLGAMQPFVSMSLSKTVNMPEDSTVDDIAEAYYQAWKLGIKCVSIYRDGCKRSQPLSTGGVKEADAPPQKRTPRHYMPDERQAVCKKFSVGGHTGYLHVGLYENGEPGEIFITMSKQGSTINGLLDGFATVVSIGLQYGVPLPELIRKLKHSSFQPMGYTGDPEFPFAKSIFDYIFRYLETRFCSDASGEEPEAVAAVEGTEVLPRAVEGGLTGPPCTSCGSITQPAGRCYICPNCGTTSGCS